MKRLEAIRAALTSAGEPESHDISRLTTTYDLTAGPPARREFYAQMLDRDLGVIYSEGWPTDNEALMDGSFFKETTPYSSAGVFRVGDTVALAVIGYGEVHLEIAAASREEIEDTVSVFRAAYPFAEMPQDDLVPVTFWSYGRFGPQSYTRRIVVNPWENIEGNYTADVRTQLDGMMDGFEPGKGGQLLLWQGPPGTGKTWALRALASEWREWADVHYITDPDAFFGEHADYMVEVLLRESFSYESGEPVEKWRLLVLEDTGELLSSDAKQKSGQGLSRLLNVVDGLIGQGLQVLVLVTTNDEIEDFHPAVSRPGRCAVEIEFAPLTPEEAEEWLGEEAEGAATLAELYARTGRSEDGEIVAGGQHHQPELPFSPMKPKTERRKRQRARKAVRVAITEQPVAAVVASGDAVEVEDAIILSDGNDANGSAEFEIVTDEALVEAAPVESQGASSLEWIATLAPEGTPTDDGRMFQEGAISWRELPLTLMAQLVTADGHDEAQVAGRIDNIWRDGTMIRASGVFDDSDFGREVARMVGEGVLRGISIDIAVREYEMVAKATEEGEEEPDLLDLLLGGEDMIFLVTDGIIGAVTVCSFPAFEQASITLAASGAPIWTLTMQSGMVVTKAVATDPDPEPPAITASAAGLAPVTPPADWFVDPELTEPTPLTIDESGRVFGHIALWGTCHIGLPACTQPPESMADYAFFHLGQIEVADGDGDDLRAISCGKITLGTGHAGSRLSMQRAAEHYDNTGAAVADVIAGQDANGIWIAGAIRPDLTVERLRELRAATLSGDWREQDGNLELVAVLAVNVPGFPVPRPRALVAASEGDGDQVLALTAAGILPASSMLNEGDLTKLADLARRARGGEDDRFAQLAARARAA